MRPQIALLGSLLFVTPILGATDPSPEYNRDIRPILSDNCFRCHGPDSRQRKAGLRLDVEADAKTALKSGSTAIVAGSSSRSELIARVTASDPDERMPPAESGRTLSPQQIELLVRWIDAGAPYQPHWSLMPIQRPAPPKLDDTPAAEPRASASGPVRNPIDAFVLAKLREQGLRPSPEADRATLVRRLSFDLIGLAPTPQEVDRFVNDPAPDAYERLVDRLLESPHFGERLTMFWLDLVRYADSVGYHGDQPVSISPFRDYVIRSFNENKPFDQFTIEQLAGDLLPDRGAGGPPASDERGVGVPPAELLELKIASGYNRLGMMSAEGGVQDREYLAKYAAERVRNLAGTWLGITLGCCECHDHKYDPFSTRDFYRLEAFFADIQERGVYLGAHADGKWGPSIAVPTPEQAVELARLDSAIAAVRAEIDRPRPELAAAQAEWEKSAAGSAEWVPFQVASAASAGGAKLDVLEDRSILASGPAPAKDTYTVTAKLPSPPAGITAVRLEMLTDPSLPKNGPGRAENGNFVVTEISAHVQREPNGRAQPLVLDHASASFEQTAAAEKNPYKAWSAASAIDADAKGPNWGWAVLPEAGRANEAVFETVLDVAAGPDAVWTFELKQNHDNPQHTLGHFRLSATASPRPVRAAGAGLPANIRDLLAVAPDKRSDEQKAALAAYYRSIAPALAPEREKLAELEKAKAALDKRVTTTLVTVAVPPRTMRVLPRGNWMDESGEIVTPGVPAVLPALECGPGAPESPLSPGEQTSRTAEPPAEANAATSRRTPNRLDLARWLVSPENPLTARVLVNRLWKLYFGAGLSTKLDDLGAQGDWPSHPELLDWLASEFMQPTTHHSPLTTHASWDIKHIIRLIVTSGTYRQVSVATRELREKDSANRWLARQGRWRLDAELVRDAALTTSGLLVPTVGGPSVKPYQPPGYWAYLNFPTREWQNGTGDELYRRGLYTHWQRQYLHPSMAAFDAPCREECTAERGRSNTPLQSLALLNDPIYVEAARAFAERVIREGGPSDPDRLKWAFRQALSRPIQPAEASVLADLLHKHRDQYGADAESATALVAIGAKPPAADIPPAELAAWTSVTRTILNLHEAITRD